MFNLINILFEILVILKLVISYKFKKDGFKWIITMDYFFIVLNFLYILFIVCVTVDFFTRIVKNYNRCYKTCYFITSFDNIKISNFLVSNDFMKMNKKNKIQFLLDNYDNIYYEITDEEYRLINLINLYRLKNFLSKLYFNNKLRLNNFMLEFSETIIFPEKNFFVIENKKYLFKYPVGEFENEFKNENPIILTILQKENLNYIEIITKDNIQFIYIYEISRYKIYLLNEIK